MSKLIKLNPYQFTKKYFPSVRLDGWLGVRLRAQSGMPFDSKKDHELWETITGGIEYNHKTFVHPQNVCNVGSRQIGKSLDEAITLSHRNFTFDLPLIPGKTARNAILCPTVQSGMPVFDYCAALISENDVLSKYLVPSQPWQNPVIKNRQQGLMRFSNRTTIEIIAATRLSGRGLAFFTLCLDETAHHRMDEGSRFSDVEVFKSATPALSTFGNKSMTMMCSTPYDKSGLLWKVYKKHFGIYNPNWLVLQIPVWLGNPEIDERFLRQQEESDPQWYRREYGAEFLEQVNAAFSTESVEDCLISGRRRLPYNPAYQYFAFIDPASLSLSASSKFNDEFVSGVAHCEGETIVIDSIVAWSAKKDGQSRITPDDAVGQSINLFKQYHVRAVQGDRFQSGYLEHKITDAGFTFEACKLAKSDLYLNLIPLLNDRKVELLDDSVCITQLKQLERTRGRNSRDRIDHKDQDNAHDDRANVCAGLIFMAAEHRNVKPFSLEGILSGNFSDRPSAAEELFGQTEIYSDWNDIL